MVYDICYIQLHEKWVCSLKMSPFFLFFKERGKERDERDSGYGDRAWREEVERQREIFDEALTGRQQVSIERQAKKIGYVFKCYKSVPFGNILLT